MELSLQSGGGAVLCLGRTPASAPGGSCALASPSLRAGSHMAGDRFTNKRLPWGCVCCCAVPVLTVSAPVFDPMVTSVCLQSAHAPL